MSKNYSISINLNGQALENVQYCQNILKDKFSITYMSEKSVQPHINIISGESNKINSIINILKGFNPPPDRSTNIIGLGILLTPAPLLYLRFTNTVFLQQLRKYIYKNTSTMWSKLDETTDKNFWIPKSTIAFRDFSVQQISGVIDSLDSIKFQCLMSMEELCIMECLDQEIEIERFKI